jgi:type IV pilus assembly protein PilV
VSVNLPRPDGCRATCGFSTRESGITLIEMLISVLVLTFGLLGIAGLIAQSLKNNQNAYLRTQATVLAYDMLDRMRSNRTAALSGSYNYNDVESPALTATIPATNDRANKDLTNWLNALQTDIALPGAVGAVECNAASSVCTVLVEVNDRRENTGTDAADRAKVATRILVTTEI